MKEEQPIQGRGTTDDPVRRGEFGCAVRGCEREGVNLCITVRGQAVSYCMTHRKEAERAELAAKAA